MAFVRAKTYKKEKFKHSSLRDSSISCDSRKIHCLTREFHVKLNVKFARQAMDFPIEVTAFLLFTLYDFICDVSTMPSYYVSTYARSL